MQAKNGSNSFPLTSLAVCFQLFALFVAKPFKNEPFSSALQDRLPQSHPLLVFDDLGAYFAVSFV